MGRPASRDEPPDVCKKDDISDRLIIESPRLRLSEFEITDAEDVFNCITPAITRYMFWEPPQSFVAYKARREAVLRFSKKAVCHSSCGGSALWNALESQVSTTLMRARPNSVFGSRKPHTVTDGGKIVGTRTSPKYNSVVYEVPGNKTLRAGVNPSQIEVNPVKPLDTLCIGMCLC